MILWLGEKCHRCRMHHTHYMKRVEAKRAKHTLTHIVCQFNYILAHDFKMLAKMQRDIHLRNALKNTRTHTSEAFTVRARFNITNDAKLLFMERDPASNEHLCTFVLSIYSHQSLHFEAFIWGFGIRGVRINFHLANHQHSQRLEPSDALSLACCCCFFLLLSRIVCFCHFMHNNSPSNFDAAWLVG